MEFTLSFSCDNAAFDDDIREELASILQRLARSVLYGAESGSITDTNGNTVGAWRLTSDE